MQLIYNTIKSLAYVLTEPYYLIILVVVGIVCYLKNKKIVFMNNMIIGESSQSAENSEAEEEPSEKRWLKGLEFHAMTGN